MATHEAGARGHLRAEPGDHIVIAGLPGGGEWEVITARGVDGTAPFVVRSTGGGHEVLLYPGPHATLRRARRVAGRPGG